VRRALHLREVCLIRLQPREDFCVSLCSQAAGARGSEAELAGEHAYHQLRRPGEDQVGVLGCARAGVHLAVAGFDRDRL
jgi:hypothetical protein